MCVWVSLVQREKSRDSQTVLPPVQRESPAGKSGPEFQNPPSHRFIGNLQASLGQQLLHIAVAQGESEIKPDRVLDDRRWEAMSTVGDLIHSGILPFWVHPLGPCFCDIASGRPRST